MAGHGLRAIWTDNQKHGRGETLTIPYPILGLVPGLVWLAYFYGKDRRGRHSFASVGLVFVLGCFTTVPAAILEHVTGAALAQETLLASALVSFLLIGPVEESFKLVAVWIGVYRSQDFREPIDGIVFATTAALGFASVENIIYMGYMGPEIILSRTVFATPAHVMFSSMWGYSLGLARFKRRGELAIVSKGLLAASGLHGVYNFVVAVHPKAAVWSLIPLMAIMAWLMARKIREFRRTSPFLPIGQGPVVSCPNCGAYTLEQSTQCSRCGFEIPPLETDTPRFCGRCRALLDPSRTTCSRCGEPIDLSHLYAPISSAGVR